MRYVAFLRAVNVGGRVVRMHDLRCLFETAGLSRVETYIQSGNVIFDAPPERPADLERLLEDRLERELGYRVATFLRSSEELARVGRRAKAAAGKLDPAEALYVAFTRAEVGREVARAVEGLGGAADELRVAGREVYWLCRRRPGKSLVTGAKLEKALGMPATVRNSTTVTKLAATCDKPHE